MDDDRTKAPFLDDNLRTRRYAFTSRLRGLHAQGTCQDTAEVT